ncbi:hypothetical protein BN1232_00041 [Mycobacterium lentiflavum]|uniref:Uncharacterized protein n=1 Tax=Mycobacterium lentiflavum TaxID=141349 RepID=A0A0E4GUF1_MYCLN|nr:hypothetical protein [Mycobacterium lentiflavum]MEE3064216.1 hypothetical protein [Actinomycetota bacterium]ULP42335.1 hypothetical protein MJO58_26770 [Mycobacterium lentiflavum]CQD02225.1 hypothetical protein BN1232_00041 [Mycobacterium lentiflavum]
MNWTRIIAGAVVSGGVAAAGLGLAVFATADGPHYWCPGDAMPASPGLTWDMTVCHQYHQLSGGQIAEGPAPGTR